MQLTKFRRTGMSEAFDTIVRSGKARYIGISNILAYRLARSR